MTTPWIWVIAGALALAAVVAGVRSGAVRAGVWAAFAALGQAAALSLVKAGPAVGYQHYLGWREARERPVALGVAVAVAVVAFLGALRYGPAIGRWLRGRAGRWKWVVAAGIATLLAAAPSVTPSAYVAELVAASVIQFAVLSCVVLAAVALPAEKSAAWQQRLDRWLDTSTGAPRLDSYAWTLASATALVASLLCLASYQAIPHVPDEIAYLLQARYYAEGLPWMAPPPAPGAFDTFLLEVAGDRWYSVFPPGWPLLLALGVRLGVPWLVNPLLGGACILLTYLLVQELADRRLARLTILLMAVSPWHLFLSMSFMSHVLSLALALLVAIGAVRAYRTGAWGPAAIGGLALGVLGMSRPLEGVAMGVLAGVPLLVAARARTRRVALAAAIGGTLVTGILGLAYNRAITGSPFHFPAEQFFDREYGPGRYGIGFGPEKGVGWTGLDPFPGHDARDVGINAILNGFMVNIDLFGWACGSIAIVLLGLFHARSTIERLMMIAAATVILLHSAFWFSGGPDFGARYWYLILVPLAVLAARGLIVAEHPDRVVPGARTAAAAGWLSILALMLFVPWRAADKYRYYRGVRADLVSWKADARFRNGLVLVSGERHPDWAGAALANDLHIGDTPSPVFAWDRDSTTQRAVLDAFPDRVVWQVDGPTRTGQGYRLRRGPVLPDDRPALPSGPYP